MKQRAIQNRGEPPVIALKGGGDIAQDESGVGQATFVGGLNRGIDRRCRYVDAHNAVALRGQLDRRVTDATAGIEDLAAQLAQPNQFGDRRLRLTDIPRRRTLEDSFLPVRVVSVHYFRHGNTLHAHVSARPLRN
jgi:hypothetical protein